MAVQTGSPVTEERAAELELRMQPRLHVEEYFARSGRTLRKSRSRLWFNETVKPAVIRLILETVGLYRRGVRNAIRPVARHLDLVFPNLPPGFDGFTILQISDPHIDRIDGLAEALAEVIAPLRPDLCVFTGDYRYEIRGSCAEVYPRMQIVLDSVHARLGSVAILGNHDAAEIARWLQARGVGMLVNDAVRLENNGDEIWIAGLDDSHDYRCQDLPLALSGVPASAFKVLLAHSPALYREAADAGVDLYLCGHTHGGQIRLPGIGALKKNGDYPRAFVQGSWGYKLMRAYTSWGAGCSTLPVRFNCPPEVSLFRLRTA